MTDNEILKLLLDKVNMLETLVEKVDRLEPLIEKVDRLEPLIEKVDRLEPLIEKVDRLEPLIEKVDRLEPLIEKVDRLEVGQQEIKGQLAENTAILRALEHRTDIQKAEIDSIHHKVATIEGDVKSISKDQQSFNTEFNDKMDNLTAKFETLESITKDNLYDIAKLKVAK